jgi:hypothetical protein
VTRDELAFLFGRAGLDVAPETVDELAGIYGYIDAMLESVHDHDGSEPMLVFAPLEPPQ